MNVTWNGKGSRTVTQFEAAAFRGDSRGGFCGNPSLCLQFTRGLFPFEAQNLVFSSCRTAAGCIGRLSGENWDVYRHHDPVFGENLALSAARPLKSDQSLNLCTYRRRSRAFTAASPGSVKQMQHFCRVNLVTYPPIDYGSVAALWGSPRAASAGPITWGVGTPHRRWT
jgi:hypothetical protein